MTMAVGFCSASRFSFLYCMLRRQIEYAMFMPLAALIMTRRWPHRRDYRQIYHFTSVVTTEKAASTIDAVDGSH